MQPTDTQCSELGHAIAEIAYELFCACDAESDFCVNNTNGIFGSVNRLRITPNGWVASEHHCTERFLNKWREIQSDLWKM